jgi:hypothetical protein
VEFQTKIVSIGVTRPFWQEMRVGNFLVIDNTPVITGIFKRVFVELAINRVPPYISSRGQAALTIRLPALRRDPDPMGRQMPDLR